MNDSEASHPDGGAELLKLLQASRRGELNSQDELFQHLRRYFETIVSQDLGPAVGRKFGQSDVVQESCVSAIRGLDQFQGKTEGELRAWLRTLLANEVNQIGRGLSRQKRDVRRELPIDGDSFLGIQASQPTDPAVTPRTAAINREKRDAIEAAIGRLPEHYRTVLELRLWQKKSYAEVAERIGKSIAATEKLWYRAIQRMRQELEQNDD